MRTEQIEVYSFDELSDDAKESAREWWRQCENECFDTEFMYDDFQRVAEIVGVEFDQQDVPLMNGSTRQKPKIWWSGFCSQGDGACFEGYYSYAKGAAKKIREYAPSDKTLHEIADTLQDVQRPAFYGLSARCSHHGHYYHSGCMVIDTSHEERYPTSEEEDEITEALRSFANWMYRQLEAEYEYRMSDENVDEAIRMNEYEFTADGSIY